MSGTPDAHANPAVDPATWLDDHGDALFRYALLRLRDREKAEDAVQECLLAALAARERFEGQSSERTWLIGILKRKIVDAIRRSSRESPVEDPEAAQSAGEGFFDNRGFWRALPARWKGDPGQSIEDREFWDIFRRCIEKLPVRLADAFLLREMDQMKSDEVCQVLSITPTNLWAQLHRARLGLRRCLETHWFAGRRKDG